MEVVGAVASAVTLLGAALKGTESIYQIICSLKNVSSHAKSLESAINGLKAVLTQLHNTKAVTANNGDLSGLKKLLAEYNADLQRYEKELEKIRISATDTRKERLAKKVRGTFQGDRDLLRILGQVTQRCVTLGTQLNASQLSTTVEVRDKVRALTAASSTHAQIDASHTQILRQHGYSLAAIDNGVGKVQTALVDIQDAVATVTQKMEQIPRVSQTQSDDIRTLLLALQSQIAGLSKQSDIPSSIPSRSSSSTRDTEDTEKESKLTASIARLCKAALEKEGSVHNEDAESLVGDLEAVLECLSADDHHLNPSKRKSVLDDAMDIAPRELKRLRALVASSEKVDLNVPARRARVTMAGKISQRRKSKEISQHQRHITISFDERHLDIPHSRRPGSPYSRYRGVETMARVNVLDRSGTPMMLTAYVYNTYMQNGFSCLNPILSIGKILPDDSPLFGIVESGDVDGLRNLLTQRQCTLRDRDSRGTPLLHYAMSQPRMCKFLVENGADVDEIAYGAAIGEQAEKKPPLVYGYASQLDVWHGNHSMALECQRILLQAGADPTLYGSDGWDLVHSSIYHGPVDLLKAVLDHGGLFIDLKARCSMGHTYLLSTAHSLCSHETTKYELLLDRGANVHARDAKGNTCLHIAIKSMENRHQGLSQVESLAFLFRRGADIFATNHQGLTAFDYAYECEHHDGKDGSYRGDVWDAALFRGGCGKYMRKPEDRRCHYTRTYTKHHFVSLWEGLGTECPYFSAPVVMCPLYRPRSRRQYELDPDEVKECMRWGIQLAYWWEDMLVPFSSEEEFLDTDDEGSSGGVVLGEVEEQDSGEDA